MPTNKNLKPSEANNSATATSPQEAKTFSPETSPKTDRAELAKDNKASAPFVEIQGHQFSHSDFDDIVLEVLNDFEYVQRKETKVLGPDPQPLAQTPLVSDPSVSEKLNADKSRREKLSNEPRMNKEIKIAGVLMGILGPCGLPGHIAHFYNSNMQIERHIRTVSDLGHERFVRAYEYLKANAFVEAVFIYENRFMAVQRENGQLRKFEFI